MSDVLVEITATPVTVTVTGDDVAVDVSSTVVDVEVGTSGPQGIPGVTMTSYVQTAITGGPFITQYSLAFGHTNVSLATTESASFATGTTKAPRRVPLAAFTQAVPAAQAVSTIVSQPGGSGVDFTRAPIYVNPGEFVAVVAKKIGTVATAGVLGHVIRFDYSWE